MRIQAQISAGELFDKISILDIKLNELEDRNRGGSGPGPKEQKAIANVEKEREVLLDIAEYWWKPGVVELFRELAKTNVQIWDALDELRAENKKWWRNPWKLTRLARTICVEGDRRDEIKRKIDDLLESEIVGEKVYRGL